MGRAALVIVKVDHNACSGHARCNAILPAIFTLDDVGYSSVGESAVPAGDEELVRLAVANCPEQAISIVED